MSSSVPGPEFSTTPGPKSLAISSAGLTSSEESELASPSTSSARNSKSSSTTTRNKDPMAAVVALPTGAVNNRKYRPTPAKTFQCRGYGECRMVFSRSEHLARHIRKHTGERPFNCHCGKQFSRLDNLRQHAQTVHADKQDQNERMMRDLTSLHASMAAANKATARGRRQSTQIKHEDSGVGGLGRPGTATGYEGWDQGQDVDMDSPTTHTQSPNSAGSTQSFLDSHQQSFQSFRSQPSQSFRASELTSLNSLSNHNLSNAAGSSTGGEQFRPTSQSFRGREHHHTPLTSQSQSFTSSRSNLEQSQFQFNLPTSPVFPQKSSSSRPSTSNTQLPPLSSVLPASLAALPPTPVSRSNSRPSTGTKPEYLHGLGPAFPPPPGSSSGVSTSVVGGLNGPATEGGRLLQFPLPSPPLPHGSSNARVPRAPSTGFGFSVGHGGSGGYRPGTAPSSFHFAYRTLTGGGNGGASSAPAPAPTEPMGGEGDSPFSFNPPSANELSRKRKFNDEDDDERDRPQSRRLTVMELCGDSVSPTSASRPTTTSGIVRGAAGLYIGLPGDDEETTGGADEESRERSSVRPKLGGTGRVLSATTTTTTPKSTGSSPLTPHAHAHTYTHGFPTNANTNFSSATTPFTFGTQLAHTYTVSSASSSVGATRGTGGGPNVRFNEEQQYGRVSRSPSSPTSDISSPRSPILSSSPVFR
ncbi:hypothetical protein E1B28_002158 [Marasmius oreades]|uniref:C2H2-type domain-containing protein n=1 Tax=Marasmius oreades TaxID=181124 RepID=A0A9P7UL86_9AGAR|nr:uncharacterized protein E1B28_002158 [Marasmius oreades]KAG7086195.1 hypothetical protein E1B28_002158 [Marasmius oreades]